MFTPHALGIGGVSFRGSGSSGRVGQPRAKAATSTDFTVAMPARPVFVVVAHSLLMDMLSPLD